MRVMKCAYEFQDFRLDPEDHRLLRNGQQVHLTPKVFQLLVLLIESRGHILSKEYILKTLWPDTFIEENNLNRNISTLRRVLGETPEEHKYIETIPKIGFRFVADVKELWDNDANLLGDVRIPDESILLHETQSQRPEVSDNQKFPVDDVDDLGANNGAPLEFPAKHKSAWTFLRQPRLAVAVLLVLSLAGIALYLVVDSNNSAATDSIAVLPFVNVGGDPAIEYLADGITENIINKLSELGNLKVISRASVFRYKGNAVEPRTAGRELNVSALLMGRLLEQSDSVSVHVELVNVKDGSLIWGGQFRRNRPDITALQEEISRITAEKLKVNPGTDESARLFRRHTENSAAYHLYLKGLYYRNKKTEEGMKKAIEYFEQAVDTDPSYGVAYAAMAYCYNWLSRSGRAATPQLRTIAEAMARKALAIDDTLGEAHLALADVRFTILDWEGLEAMYRRAIELSPNNSDTHGLFSLYLAATRRFDEAIREARKARELDPLAVSLDTTIGVLLYMARQFDSAIKQLHEALEMDSNYLLAHQSLGESYTEKGMYKEAIAEYEQAMHLLGFSVDGIFANKVSNLSGDGISFVARLGYVYGLSGERSNSRRVLGFLDTLPKQTFVSPVLRARIHLGLGEYDQAITLLEKAYESREGELVWLGVSPIYDPIRSDPRFQKLQQRISFTP